MNPTICVSKDTRVIRQQASVHTDSPNIQSVGSRKGNAGEWPAERIVGARCDQLTFGRFKLRESGVQEQAGLAHEGRDEDYLGTELKSVM